MSSIISQIEEVKEKGGCKVKVIENVGDFRFIVTLQNTDPEFTLKFQFPDEYPNDPPGVILSSKTAPKGNLLEITKSITSKLCSWRDTNILSTVMDEVRDKVQTLNLSNASDQKSASKQSPRRQRKKAKKAKSGVEEDDDTEKKMASMKTAMDVINRILWDESIPKECITIAYVDRFLGIVEKPFHAFSWEDIASVDYYTFAIPKHRIQYFKYERAVIWDKTTRLDNVFGSLGSGVTIADVISNYNEEDYRAEGEEARTTEWLGRTEEQDSGSEDDGIDIVMTPQVLQRSSSLALSADEDECYDEEGTAAGGAEKVYWRDKLRPNFFVCIRVTDPDVQSMASHIQDVLCGQEARYEECCVPDTMLHITLATLRLQSAEQCSDCLQVLREAEKELKNVLPKTPLKIRGLARFYGRVLYARVESEALVPLVEHVSAVLRTAGMPIVDSHEFVPHMSLIKVSRPVSRVLGSKNISPLLFHGAEDVEFGEQPVEAIYLCSMEKTRGPDGFYISPGHVTFMQEIIQNK